MSYLCSSCGKEHSSNKTYPNRLCQSCYNYFRKGGTINPLPETGRIVKDYRGYIVCHICGKAYVKLGGHIKESHNMTIAKYKEQFGLCNNCKTTEDSYSNTMNNYAYEYHMPEQLKEVGKATRIKTGDTHMRLGKEVRLQERLNKRHLMEG